MEKCKQMKREKETERINLWRELGREAKIYVGTDADNIEDIEKGHYYLKEVVVEPKLLHFWCFKLRLLFCQLIKRISEQDTLHHT